MGVLLASLLGLTAFCMWCLWVDKREEKKPLCWVRKDADGTIWIQCDKTFKGTVLGVDGKGRVIYEVDDD